MIASFYGKDYSIETLRERSYVTREGVSMMGISDAAESIGFRTLGIRIDSSKFTDEFPLPCIIHWNLNHFVILYKIKGKGKNSKYYVADPAGGKLMFSQDEFLSGWLSHKKNDKELGTCLLLEPTPDFYSLNAKINDKSSFGFMFSYLKPYRGLLIQLILSLLFASIVQLILPFLTQSVVDIGINQNHASFIFLVLIAQLVLMISKSSVEFIRGWILLHLGVRVNISLISDFLIKLMKLPISFFDSKMIGDITQRINDHERIESFLTSSSLQILFSFFNLLIFGIVLLIYSLKIFLIFLIGSTIYTIWVSVFMKKKRQLDNKHFALMAANQSNIFQLITGMQEIKLNNCEKQKRWEWENIQIKTFKISIKSLSINQLQQAGALIINETKNIIITFMAAMAVINGNITLGAMLAIQYIIGQLNSPLDQMINFFQTAQNAKLSLERLGEIHLKEDEQQPDECRISSFGESKSIIISDVSFQYEGPNSKFVLRDINLTMPEGKITAIVGASGSGKTTLLKLILGFYLPIKGSIKIGENQLIKLSTHFWRQNCGIVMQDGYIFSDTIARNIAISDENIDINKLYHAVKVANIKEYIESLPLNYNTLIGSEGVGLSQGQKQRILIARAVYKNPKFLFFDEATNALDANNELQILKNLADFFKGRTVVIVAHRLSTVKNADQIIVLENGNIVEKGKHNELILSKKVYYSLVKNQLELGG